MGLPPAACPRGFTAVSVGLEPGFGSWMGKPKYLFTAVCFRTAGILILFEQKILLENDNADRYSLKTAKLKHGSCSSHDTACSATAYLCQLVCYLKCLQKYSTWEQNNYLHACISWHGTKQGATPKHKRLHRRSKSLPIDWMKDQVLDVTQ